MRAAKPLGRRWLMIGIWLIITVAAIPALLYAIGHGVEDNGGLLVLPLVFGFIGSLVLLTQLVACIGRLFGKDEIAGRSCVDSLVWGSMTTLLCALLLHLLLPPAYAFVIAYVLGVTVTVAAHSFGGIDEHPGSDSTF